MLLEKCKEMQALFFVFNRGLYKAIKERVRIEWARVKFGVKLRTQKKWVYVSRKFSDLHENVIGRCA